MATTTLVKRKKKPISPALKFTVNDLASLMNRASRFDPNQPDPRRDLDVECGYPKNPSPKYFIDMFENYGLANRVVSIYPNDCFGVQPEVYETNLPKPTGMEEDWQGYMDDPYTNPIHFLHQADIESRKGRFGIILQGYDDGKDLSKPVEGVDDNDLPAPRSRDNKLLYMRAFNESNVFIKAVETKKSSRRNGRPTMYDVNFVKDYKTNGGVTSVSGTENVEVHWTRVIHVAEGGHVFATETLRDVYKHVLDVAKISGSSGEMFYKGGFSPLSLELDPRVLELKNITFDLDSVHADVQKFLNGLQRVLTLVGFNAKSLAPQVADPSNHLTSQLQLIAIAKGIPLRILMGAESGQLASAQDVKNWNRRLKLRQAGYIQNYMLRPLVNRLINVGAVRAPVAGPSKYKVYWPDVNIPDENEQSMIADRLAAALMKYMMSGAFKIMQISTFFRVILHIPADEVKAMMKELKKKPEIDYEELLVSLGKGPADSGVKGESPSNPPRGGVVD